MDVSIVIPLLNEEESLNELHDWIVEVMQSNRFLYEILFIDDGSTDDSWSIITKLSASPNVKGLRFKKNFGKSQALHAGFEAAQGDVVITMDADLQDNPEEIPELYRLIKNEGYDLISGWKKKRYDSVITKNIPSKLFNWAARKTSGLKLHDFNCGLKAYKKEVIKNIELQGEMHRYIPVLAKSSGFGNIGEKIVQHQARKYGKTKFGMERFINGFLDLITIWFVSKFGRRPMHLFGALGVAMFIIGFGFALYLGVDKLFINPGARLITQRPEFYISLISMVIGTQLFLAGFLGELLVRSQNDKKRYTISEDLNLTQRKEQYSS
jgi:glycosyltransferase involved in cell wall biosynthesis